MIDLAKIKFIPSPHKASRNGVKPTHLIVHAMAGTYQGSISWFKNPVSKVSAHYLVSKKGEITCMVQPGPDKAWHVKNFNTLSIGVEFEDLDPKTRKGCVTDPNWCTEVQYKVGAELFATLMQKFNIPLENVVGHNADFLKKAPYFNTHTDPEKHFNWDKFKTLIKGFLADGSKPK